MILNGVGVYHAGLDFSDRRLVEELFIAQALSVVCTTSSLAQGVNLPVRSCPHTHTHTLMHTLEPLMNPGSPRGGEVNAVLQAWSRLSGYGGRRSAHARYLNDASLTWHTQSCPTWLCCR